MKTKHKIIIISSIIAAVVGLCVWDIADPPMWQSERRTDKKAILDYVENNYPDTIKRIGGDRFPIQMPAGPHESSVMHFELDGTQFAVTAEYGKILFDGYDSARATAQFDKILQDGFFKPRGISVQIDYRFSFAESDSVYPYTGVLGVMIKVREQGSTPQEVGWLYDFYKYWESEGSFLKGYNISIDVRQNGERIYHINYNNEGRFSNEEEFLAAFKQG